MDKLHLEALAEHNIVQEKKKRPQKTTDLAQMLLINGQEVSGSNRLSSMTMQISDPTRSS